MSKSIVIGCRLPNGIILDLNNNTVEIAGLNKAVIIGADHVTTEIDADFWDAWKAKNSGFAPLVSGSLFEAKSQGEASAKAKELKTKKTGFEKMPESDGAVKSAKD